MHENHDHHYGKESSFRIFNRIHKRYDFLNHLFSFGRDKSWRKKLCFQLTDKKNQHVLDLATGTGDVALSLLKTNPHISHVYGCDLASNMIETGRLKAIKFNIRQRIAFFLGDASNIPSADNRFHAVTMAFGIRNTPDPSLVLREIRRVLKNEGRALILEFSIPSNKLLRAFHLFYLRTVIPPIGAWISGDSQAYRYLGQTIEAFPYGEDFCQLMRTAGFSKVTGMPLTFGAVTLYRGEKPGTGDNR